MKKNTFCLLLFTIILMISCKSEGNILIKNSTTIDNDSPKKAFNLYWSSASKGDIEAVRQISGESPEDMFQDCVGRNTELKVDDASLPKSLKTEDGEELPKDVKSENIESNIDNIFMVKDIPEDIAWTSLMVYDSEIPFERVRINSEKIYENEAIYDISILDEEGTIDDELIDNQIAFFYKTNEGWKFLGMSIKSGKFSDIEKINYAKFRPVCSEAE